jgi:hypothetical protein
MPRAGGESFEGFLYDSQQDWTDAWAAYHAGSNRQGVQGAHSNPLGLFLNPLGLCLRTSIPFIWRVLSAFPTRLNPLAERTCFSQVPRRAAGALGRVRDAG